MMKQKIELEQGWKLNMVTGACEKSQEDCSSTLLFYRVFPGSILTCKDRKCIYECAAYSLKQPVQYIYSYAYQMEQQWTTYLKDESVRKCNQEKIRFGEEGYIRLTVYKENGEAVQDSDAIFQLEHPKKAAEENFSRKSFLYRNDIQQEIEKTIQTIEKKKEKDSLVFTILSDTHYVVNGNWEDTVATIEAVNRRVRPDGIIHLGDLADGILNKDICRNYSQRVLEVMKSWQLPIYLAIGNHDVNYFAGNPERLDEQEQYEYYLKDTVSGNLKSGQLWYSQDYEKQKLRFLFLHSFDPTETNRYGFPEEEVVWVENQLNNLPEGYQVLLFSHDAPLERLDYWAKEIRNGEKLMRVLENWHKANDERILGFIHGHTHADFVYYDRAFPIISLGCSKCEYFTDKKPEGAVCYYREPGTVLQELWDTMIIYPQKKQIDFVRFGAGIDRTVKAKKEYKTKVWAHRGASGYAPENTLEAFRLAVDMGADGIELDVQFTKDREVVVLHDETINRTSNGTGFVMDHTLEQLKKLRFNKTHPEYEDTTIPTLKEVLELIKPTKLMINIELKTGINFYGGIEEAVIDLVEEAGMEDRVIYSSFNHVSVKRVKVLRPQAKVGLLYHDGIYAMPDYAEKNLADAIHPALYNMQYPQLVEKCRERNQSVHVWTVNAEKDMLRMCEMGVDAIITNYPDVACKIIKGIEVEWKKTEAVLEVAKEEPVRNADLIKTEQQKVTRENTTESANNKEKVGLPENLETMIGESKTVQNKNVILYGMGGVYSKVRKVFVAIDRKVQSMAGK